MPAMFTNRQLNISTKDKGRSAEKLNTGYRINRASDDAAGLSMSERMRWQVRGLDKADDNCNAGASFCQVADGAMNEIQDIIHRMRELSVQAANDTNTAQDRAAIQSEMNELVAEVGNITTDTKFNDIDVFGFERTRELFLQEPANGEWITTNIKEVINVTGTNYGLAEVVGNDHIWSQNKLNSQFQFAADKKWHSTGTDQYLAVGSITAADNVMNVLKHYLPTQANSVSLHANTISSQVQILNEGDYRATITYDPKRQSLDGSYPAQSVRIDKQQVDSAGNPVYSYVYSANLNETVGSTGYASGKNYGAGWVDFSGLGTDYTVDSLFNQGFNSSCDTCSRPYNFYFTDKTYENQLSNGMSFQSNNSWNSPRIEIGIASCTSGEDLVKAIMEALEQTPNFTNHYTQYAYNEGEPGKFYVFDARTEYAYGGISTFEPAIRDENRQIVINKTIVTKPDPVSASRWVYKTKDLWIQSGALEKSGFFIEKPKVNPKFLGIDQVGVMDYDRASDSITVCDNALSIVSRERTKMGVQQNRLEAASSVDQNTSENTQAAESRLRDTDMADELVNYSKHNILEQAGMSMLTQANQSREGVLSLLMG